MLVDDFKAQVARLTERYLLQIVGRPREHTAGMNRRLEYSSAS